MIPSVIFTSCFPCPVRGAGFSSKTIRTGKQGLTKICVVSDNHAGHILGLTPPGWWRARGPIRKIQETFWNWFVENLSSSYDVCIHCGDSVDGEGKHDTSFHLTTDISEQQKIAIETFKAIKAKKYLFVTGTPYHGGSVTDYEKPVAEYFGDKISWMRKIEIEGVKINFAHTIGKTTTPVGGDIALRKQIIWNRLYSLANEIEPADIILRGHIHEYRHVADARTKVITCPALKIGNADYDRYARKMQGGFYDVGFLEIGVDKKKIVSITEKIASFKTEGGYERV